MANELKDYVADAKRFASMFSGFIKAAEALQNVTSIDQATQESTTRLNSARAAEAEFLAAHEQRKKQAEDEIAGRQREAAEILAKAEADARTRAEKAVADAKLHHEWADAEIAGKHEASDKEIAAKRAELDAAREQHAKLGEAIASRKADLKALDDLLDDRRAQHAELQRHIDAMKAKFL